MQRASDLIPSGMAWVRITHASQLRVAMAAAINHCKENLRMKTPVVCQVASYISPECKVIAGNIEVGGQLQFFLPPSASPLPALSVATDCKLRSKSVDYWEMLEA
ncbi:unnamed protein product [Dibothriocephalus latus]|uniref:Uncharacterized protein n=1 Tax=Dibothriocephalus latus TaxID=60516 RepID=A0A3P7NSS2_DIBLA|nr:unnamed protein product [Dibothriocephalus latus]